MTLPSTPPAGDSLAERYGRTPQRARSVRRSLWILASGFVVVFGAWIVWGGLDSISTQMNTQDSAHEVLDDSHVSVTFAITLDPGQTARCALQGQSEAHAIVGWKVVDIPASDLRTRSFTETVITVEPPVTGLIYRCWLT